MSKELLIIQAYLKRNKTMILVAFVFNLTFFVSFLLYQIELEVILYPFILALILAVIFVVFDYLNYRKRLFELRKLDELVFSNYLEVLDDQDLIVNEYKRLIFKLLEERKELKSLSKQQYEDMLDYYTIWTHQIKLPIASLKLKIEEANTNELSLISDLNRIEQYVLMATTYLELRDNNVDVVFKKHSLDRLIKEVIRKNSNDFIIKKIKLEYEVINFEVITDEKWFCFVLEQIISNSLKYTNEGSIKIYLNENKELCILDSGIGILKEDLPRVFEKGFSGYNGRLKKNASGLGLYLCKNICDKLNIEIKIASEINKYTEVKLSFRNHLELF